MFVSLLNDKLQYNTLILFYFNDKINFVISFNTEIQIIKTCYN